MSTRMIAGSKLKALMRFAADQDVRFYLNGIYFDRTGFAVATDGTGLMAVKIESFEGSSFIVPSAVIEAALKSKKGKAQYRYAFGVSDSTFDSVPYTPIDAKYPDWRRVIPAKLSGEHTTYSSQVVEMARKAIEDLEEGGHRHSVFITHNGRGPGVVEYEDEQVLMILMPVNETVKDPRPQIDAVAAQVATFLRAA